MCFPPAPAVFGVPPFLRLRTTINPTHPSSVSLTKLTRGSSSFQRGLCYSVYAFISLSILQSVAIDFTMADLVALQPGAYSAVWLSFVVGAIVALLRFYCRLFIVRNWGWDDWFAVIIFVRSNCILVETARLAMFDQILSRLLLAGAYSSAICSPVLA